MNLDGSFEISVSVFFVCQRQVHTLNYTHSFSFKTQFPQDLLSDIFHVCLQVDDSEKHAFHCSP